MLSVLIPIYNYDASCLITDLHAQCIAEGHPFEILVFDDGSISSFRQKNQIVQHLSNVVYTELHQNLGRSAIRNVLAAQAKYQYLLFVDCDAKVCNSQFVHNYIVSAEPSVVICGGVSYSPIKPEKNLRLRWYYGCRYEMRNVQQRQQDDWQSFSLFNTLMDKSVFMKVQCNHVLKKYGHEDTLLGCMLKQEGYRIQHIDNSLLHLGLNTNRAFLAKTKEGIVNLLQLSENKTTEIIAQQSTLISTLRFLKSTHLLDLAGFLYRIGGQLLERMVCVCPRQIAIFQLIKVLYAAHYIIGNKKS